MEFGTLAEWAGAVGGLLAVIAAVVAWQSSEKMLSLEKKRDHGRELAASREQAELVFALGVVISSGSDSEWGIYLHNGSSKPIYNVEVASQKANGKGQNYPLKLAALPPGRFVVPPHKDYHWGNPVDLSVTPTEFSFALKGQGAKTIQSVQFLDASRQQWELTDGSELKDL